MAGALDASAAKRQRLLQHINAVAEASTAEKAGAEGPPEAAVRSDDEARANGLSDNVAPPFICACTVDSNLQIDYGLGGPTKCGHRAVVVFQMVTSEVTSLH